MRAARKGAKAQRPKARPRCPFCRTEAARVEFVGKLNLSSYFKYHIELHALVRALRRVGGLRRRCEQHALKEQWLDFFRALEDFDERTEIRVRCRIRAKDGRL